MARPRLASLVFLALLGTGLSSAQQPTPRDPRAVILLQQSLAAMGGVAPPDSVTTGNVTIVAGSTTDNGTIRILTRGLEQTREQFQTSRGIRGRVYSRGLAAELSDAGTN